MTARDSQEKGKDQKDTGERKKRVRFNIVRETRRVSEGGKGWGGLKGWRRKG